MSFVFYIRSSAIEPPGLVQRRDPYGQDFRRCNIKLLCDLNRYLLMIGIYPEPEH